MNTFEGDTLEVKAPVIIFFSLGDEDYKKLKKREGIEEIFSDFNHFSKMISDSLRELKVVFSNNKYFKIKKSNSIVNIISRDTSENYVGIILADSIKAPIIKYGVFSFIDYKGMIDYYFYK